MYWINGYLASKYGYSDINIKKITPAEKDPNNINTFLISAEKWFVVKIPNEEFTNNKLNELIEDYLKE